MSTSQFREKLINSSAGSVRKLSQQIPFIGRVLILLFAAIYIYFPTYWLVSNSIRPLESLFQVPPDLIPPAITFTHFVTLFTATDFPIFLKNSIIIALGSMVATTVLATLGGYGLTRSSLSMRKKRALARSVLFVYMMPEILLGIPLYSVFYNLGMVNSYLSLILAHLVKTLPLCIWIMWQHFQTIPRAFEEAAWMNGSSRLRGLREIVIPMSKSGIAAVVIFSFAFSWNDYTFAVILMTETGAKTIPVGMANFIQNTFVNWGAVLAGSLIAAVPSFLVVFFGQRYFLKGARI